MLPDDAQPDAPPENSRTLPSDFAPGTRSTPIVDDRTRLVDDRTPLLESDGVSVGSVRKSNQTEFPRRLGRFEIRRRIGQGGMGTVFRAVDTADGSLVAIKVLRFRDNSAAGAVKRFHKEARLLADVQNDHVTRLIEVGEQEGFHYLAMELIIGIDLKSWLRPRKRLDETLALELIADIARSLVSAHAREVIHRDIKPENVLLQFIKDKESDGAGSEADGAGTEPDDDAPKADDAAVRFLKRPLSDFRVKLTDFGIARHVNQSASMEMTRAGMIIGTPRYMAPEQFDSEDGIGPSADVYSLGVTLYEILTGEPLFRGKDMMQLATMHRHEPAPSVRVRRAEISEATAGLIAPALAKQPAKRFGDAEQFLAAVERILHGEAIPVIAHPKSPEPVANRVWDKAKTWDLLSDPEHLWPFVSNTERLNQALGFPSVTYTTRKDEAVGIRKFGTFKLAGLDIAWEEHPFEWLEGKRMGILREFSSGPFRWFLSVVNLEPLPGGGTRLSHQVRIEPKNLVGRLMTTMEADWKGFRNLDRVYRRIDQAVQGKLKPSDGPDAFVQSAKMTSVQRSRLDERISRIVEDGVAPSTAQKLREVIATWAAQELAQIKPFRLADAFEVDRPSMVDACLIAAARGLLLLRWDILCPTCRAPATTREQLSQIQSHTQCEACDVAFRSNIGDAIEMVFRVHPELRTVDDQHYCIGGPEHSPHVVSQLRLEPGERVQMQTNLDIGDYLVRGPQLSRSQPIQVRDFAAPSSYQTVLSKLGTGVAVPVLRRGQQTLTLTNDAPALIIVRLERMISRDDVLTATAAAAMPRFRQLFPGQSFDSEHPVSSEEVTLMAVCVNHFETLGVHGDDASAYQWVRQWTRWVTQAVATEGGSVTKTMGEKSWAAFPRRDQAVRAAMRIRQNSGDPSRTEKGPRTQTSTIRHEASPPADIAVDDSAVAPRIGIAVHSGPTLVTTENDRLDYFGKTVRVVTSLAEMAEGDTLLTEPVYADTEIAAMLSASGYFYADQFVVPGIPVGPVRRLRSVVSDADSHPSFTGGS